MKTRVHHLEFVFVLTSVLLCALNLSVLARRSFAQAVPVAQDLGEGTLNPSLKSEAHYPILKIGSSAPDFSLPGVDGKTHKLSDYSSSRVLVIVFTCNHCPVAQMYEDRIKKLTDDYQGKGVALVAIDPDSPDGIRLNELRYTDVGDTFAGIKIRAEYRHFNFPYLYDGDNQTAAQAYGPVATPHVFVFDAQRKLRYEGRIDNSMRESLVKAQDARDAIEAVLADKPVPVAHTGAFGCTIKWKSRVPTLTVELKSMEAEPVQVEFATADDLRKVRQNPTGHHQLVYFWATWYPPSIKQLADIVAIYRTYRQRDLDVVTVALNQPDDKINVATALKNEHASTRNLQIASEDISAMQAAFDPKWDGGLPFTVVIAPDGKVLYQQQGKANDLQLRRLILANLPDFDFIGNHAYWAAAAK